MAIRPRAPKASPARSVHVTAMVANAHRVVTALSKASVKSALCAKRLRHKRKRRLSPASLTSPQKLALQ